tara:strand:- start:116 stop:352 length:237 start_codon:yes stop_codon:yes gene_type:complete
MMTDDKIYTVSTAGKGRVNIIDATTGVVVNHFTYQGEIIQGPNVTGNKTSYIVEYPNGEKKGFLRKLPQGVVINSFVV